MNSDLITQPSRTTTDVNGSNPSDMKVNIDDEDAQAVFRNNCIEQSAQDKRNAKIDGRDSIKRLFCQSIRLSI